MITFESSPTNLRSKSNYLFGFPKKEKKGYSEYGTGILPIENASYSKPGRREWRHHVGS